MTVSMLCTVAKELPVADKRDTGKGCSEAEQKKVVELLNSLLESDNISLHTKYSLFLFCFRFVGLQNNLFRAWSRCQLDGRKRKISD